MNRFKALLRLAALTALVVWAGQLRDRQHAQR